MKIGEITIRISDCTEGIYLRWWYNGWHYFNFQNGYEVSMGSESMDTHITRLFSRIAKIERPTRIKAKYSYQITLSGITPGNIEGFTGLLLAEKVEQYEDYKWYEVEITRGDHLIKNASDNSYIFDFEITRKDQPYTPTVYLNTLKLYIGDTLCDLDDDEVVPINKQVNDIAEMQDRQSDFTSQFKIRKTRAMRALFELSGEIGANTIFPYQRQPCRLVQSGVEMITAGNMILDKSDDMYYYVSIYSGNLGFFNDIEGLTIKDVTLANYDWTIANIKAGHDAVALPDYLFPLCEPSDDSGIAPIRLAGNTIEMYGGYTWMFVNVRTIWDLIFSKSGYTCIGGILTDNKFNGLFIPLSSTKITDTDSFLYSVWWTGYRVAVAEPIAFPGAILFNGTEAFRTGHYIVPYDGTYKFQVYAPTLCTITLQIGAAVVETFTVISGGILVDLYEVEYDANAGDDLMVWVTAAVYPFYFYSIAVTEIEDAAIAYSSTVTPTNHLPAISQQDFLKLICNMFGLIPEVTPRDRTIYFWNYDELYDNIAIARDWSAYLSEREDENEFKFGDYAQNNIMLYRESGDVKIDNGKGIMQINDETLPLEKEVINLPVSTCDEVIVGTTIPTTMSRIAFNKYDNKAGTYVQQETIDPRIVFIKRATGREYIVWDDEPMVNNDLTIDDPRIACSLEVAFSTLIPSEKNVGYSGLSRLLTKTNLRRIKFNLPVYEVAGLKHYIPIYLSQYRAYFYVNKINNYISGKLCTVDLIQLWTGNI